MLAFITSLRHPHNCNQDYRSVVSLFSKSLWSVCRQTSRTFRIIVVCNTHPGPDFSHPLIDYVLVDFPPPSNLKCARTGLSAVRADKGGKYAIGLLWAQQYDPSHVMFFDADDFVSNRLAELVAQNPHHPGWFFNPSYIYDQQRRTFGLYKDFHNLCGTSHIVSTTSYPLPPKFCLSSSHSEIIQQFDSEYLDKVLGGHRWTVQHCASRGRALIALPFQGAIYHTGHGENHTATSGGVRTEQIEFNQDIQHEFGVVPNSDGILEIFNPD